jgi:prepilin-type N-terminal cleavage/methylation domain-containing protein
MPLMQPSTAKCRPTVRGFTLAEMAIVMLIVGLLLGGMLLPMSKQLENRNNTETVRQLEDVKEAIIGFALANGRLPCPADPAIASGASGAGLERATCNTGNDMVGVVPWATLGLRESDPWGRRLTYRVTWQFADPVGSTDYGNQSTQSGGGACTPAVAPTQASYALCSAGDITVDTRSLATRTTTTLASEVAAVIVSHGRNGYGGYQSNIQLSGPPSRNEDETTNKTVDTTLPYTYIWREFFYDSDIPSAGCSDTVVSADTTVCEYDDIVVWIPYTTLISKTVAAGKLP